MYYTGTATAGDIVLKTVSSIFLEMLDKLGIDYIEGGYAASNAKEMQFFLEISEQKLENSKIAAFGNTHRANVKVEDDSSIRSILASKAPVATIVGNEEVVLNLTPVTSSLEQDPIETVTFGDGGVIGLPRVKIREMNTNVRVKNGEMLVIGGLIDDREAYDENKVAGLADVAGKLFMNNGDQFRKSELVVILRPVIHSM